ncbi:hypothetical protein [Burkholderia orbicola]
MIECFAKSSSRCAPGRAGHEARENGASDAATHGADGAAERTDRDAGFGA